MKTLLVWLGVILVLAVPLVGWLYRRTLAGGRRAYRQLLERISPVTDALRRGAEPERADLIRFAEHRETRKVLYETLAAARQSHLFPREHRTWEAMAEADLVAWLCHPNELGAPPDEIEPMGRVPEPAGGDGGRQYFVFRYRVHPPHWAARYGWMAGIAGPYAVADEPAPGGVGTFSRLEMYESRTPEEHVRIMSRPARPASA